MERASGRRPPPNMGTSGRPSPSPSGGRPAWPYASHAGGPRGLVGEGAQPDQMSTPGARRQTAKRAPRPSRSSFGQWPPLITRRTPPVAVARGCRVGQAADPDRLAGLRRSFGRRCESTAAFILVPRRGKSLQTKFPTSRPELRSHQVYYRSHFWVFERLMFRQQSPLVPCHHSSVLTSLLYCAVMAYIV